MSQGGAACPRIAAMTAGTASFAALVFGMTAEAVVDRGGQGLSRLYKQAQEYQNGSLKAQFSPLQKSATAVSARMPRNAVPTSRAIVRCW